MPQTAKLRAFIALELPDEVKEVLRETQRGLRARLPDDAVRWSPAEGFHLTLIFLGSIEAWQAEEVSEVLRRTAQRQAPFELSTGRLGCFPSFTRPSVVWVGLGGALAELKDLHATLEARITLRHDQPIFKPHLTLGRVKTRNPAERRQLGALIAGAPAPPPISWRAATVSLIRSELSSQGARYTPLSTQPLG